MMKSFSSREGIGAVFILEVIGRPKEHLTETLNDLIKKIDGEKGVHVISKKINEPVLMKDQKDFYTSFAEIELNVEEFLYLMILVFKYMPAHIEVLSPEDMQLTNTDLNDILNELTRRLHGYDEIARIIQSEKFVLERKLREVLGDGIVMGEKSSETKKKKSKKK